MDLGERVANAAWHVHHVRDTSFAVYLAGWDNVSTRASFEKVA
jgi:hypothetical protein